MSRHQGQIEEILYDGLSCIDDPGVRAAFLEQTCHGNPELKARLEELSALHDTAERFFEIMPELERPTLPAEPPKAGPEDGVGTRIGRYRLIERLGEGGWGVVYLAEQSEPVRRRVALKIIRVGVDSEHVIRSFEIERQTLALMDHPNIARVLDAGTTASGRPYFVMQLVNGLRITEFCDRNRLDIPSRLKLFTLVCRGIEHAHQKGIIHCDIKPSNVLVTLHDGLAVPKVIDFGIARATERNTTTTADAAAAPLIGTPAYMSPEQVDGKGPEVDTRSDIYSLGALLYKLLTGKPPRDPGRFKDAGTMVIRELLQSEPLVKPSERLLACRHDELAEAAAARSVEPSRLPRLLRGDLDAIVMRAMEKEPTGRYSTASELAADVSRHLEYEPVNARNGAGGGYRLGKLIRRNRIRCAAGAVAVLALSAGFGTSTWLFLREAEARREQARLKDAAEEARAEEAALRERAEAGETVAHAAVLINRGDVQEANELLAGVTMGNVPASLESATVFRTVAEWLLHEGRGKEAARRFAAVARAISRVDKSNSESISIHFVAAAAALLDAGDVEHYEELRHMAADRFSSTTDPIVADEVVKTCLVRPASPELLASIEPLLEAMKSNLPWNHDDEPGELMEAWQMLSLTLANYRKGDFGTAESWARRTLRHPNSRPPRTAAVHAVLSMALFRAGHPAEARHELRQAREEVEAYFQEPFQLGDGNQGFWFDWFIARVLLREAEGVIGDDA